jgi:hypothetical protein
VFIFIRSYFQPYFFNEDLIYLTNKRRNNPLSLIVALDANNKANGSLFWDDGISQLEKSDNFFSLNFLEILYKF